MITYSILRFRREGFPAYTVIKTGLTLKEAKEHVNRKDTKGEDWFDGYTKE